MDKHMDEEFERHIRKEDVMGKKMPFPPSGDRGFHAADMHKAAEELRMEGKGSHDPMYQDPHKNFK